MKITTILLCLFLSIGISAQSKHQLIAGTKYSLVPPMGFEAATAFSGFHNEGNGASIIVVEIPAPYQTLVAGFSAESLKTKGMTLTGKENITFNASQAVLLTLSQPGNGTTYLKQILVFGDSIRTVLVNGIYPEKYKAMEIDIKTSLLSTVYNEKQVENPLDAVTFKIDVGGTDFKFASFLSANLAYSTDGRIPTTKPFFSVGSSFAKVPADNHRQYSLDRLKKLPRGEFSVVKETKTIEIDGMKGYEITANGRDKDGRTELVYLMMLYNDAGDYYIMSGSAGEDFEKRLQDFKSIARTFKRK